MAVAALMKREVARIVLTRPAVEAGERLGFLPGDLYEKVHPYLRPLYDALYDMLETERVTSFMEKGAIEIAPLAYMRGRTHERLLHHPRRGAEQHRRADEDVPHPPRLQLEDGDHRRRDPGRLPASRGSGLIEVQSVLRGVPGIRFVFFDDGDVVRHQLVSAIVRAYDAHDARKSDRGSAPPSS